MEVDNEIELKNNKLIDNAKKTSSYNIITLSILLIINIILIISLIIAIASFTTEKDKTKKIFSPQMRNNANYLNEIKAIYYINDVNSKVKIINEPNDALNIDLFINGEEKNFNTEYQFEKKGEYSVEFKFNEELTDLSSLFMKITTLKSIDLTGLKTNKVKSMDKLFQDCISLEKVNLNYLDTSQVKSMKSMFEGCSNLKEVLMKEFTTSNTIYTDSMFENCFNLTKIDIDYFDLTYTESAAYMFRACYQLKEVAFKNTNNKDSSSISFKSTFSCCYSLEYLNLDLFEKKKYN